jgi:hypothetical protein
VASTFVSSAGRAGSCVAHAGPVAWVGGRAGRERSSSSTPALSRELFHGRGSSVSSWGQQVTLRRFSPLRRRETGMRERGADWPSSLVPGGGYARDRWEKVIVICGPSLLERCNSPFVGGKMSKILVAKKKLLGDC